MTAGRRDGVTIVEVAVGAALFVAVLGLIWGLPLLGRRAEKAGERDAALEASLLAQERVETDLVRVVAGSSGHPAIELGPDGRSMRFLMVEAPPAAAAAAPLTSEVAYVVEQRDGVTRLVRTQGTRREVLAGAHLRDARFELAWTCVGWMLRARFRLEVEKRVQHTVFALRLNLAG